MKNTYTIKARVVDTERKANSYYGNPRYLVTLETADGDIIYACTKVDSMLAYGITNKEYKEYKEWRIGSHYSKTCLEAVK
jgi:hypothetical protein